jgi:hypothetical protein
LSNGGTRSFPRLPNEPQAVTVRINDDYIELTLADGRRVATPLSFYPTLRAASPSQRERYVYMGPGTGLEWPQFDLMLSVDGIIAGRREHVPPTGFRRQTDTAMRAAGIKPPRR